MRNLTKKQQQLLELISDGKTNKMIALELGVMEQSIKQNVQRLVKKLCACNRANLVAVGFRRGLLS